MREASTPKTRRKLIMNTFNIGVVGYKQSLQEVDFAFHECVFMLMSRKRRKSELPVRR
jgi:hypothetical protein